VYSTIIKAVECSTLHKQSTNDVYTQYNYKHQHT